MKCKRFLYHVTDTANIESIKLGGLKRGGGTRSSCAVYLSEKPYSWFEQGKVILKVDMSGLWDKAEATTFLPDSDEIMYWGDIPAWKLTKGGIVPRITIFAFGDKLCSQV